MSVAMPEGLVFGPDGLLPVVAQDRKSGDVLMLAHADAQALARTAETGFAHFWSRSRRALWMKGETSGNRLRVTSALADCDRDALLLVVEPEVGKRVGGVRARGNTRELASSKRRGSVDTENHFQFHYRPVGAVSSGEQQAGRGHPTPLTGTVRELSSRYIF